MASRAVSIRVPDLFEIDIKVGKHRIQRLASESPAIIEGLAEVRPVGRQRYALEIGGTWVVSRRHDVPERANAALRVDDAFLVSTDEPLRLRPFESRWIHPKSLSEAPSGVGEWSTRAVNSWTNSTVLGHSVEGNTLRNPQAGALHALLAHWSVGIESATVILPTGTGKTDTMIAAMLAAQLSPLLVVVPTRALRSQIARKFQDLGKVAELGLAPDCLYPTVGILDGSIRGQEELSALLGCNVLVTTMASITESSPHLLEVMSESIRHLFIDEAHHVPAATWSRFRERFEHRKISHFTATPYRGDGKLVPGRRIYRYPLKRAQSEGYFTSIALTPVAEYDPLRADIAIRDRALERLQADIDAGYDHIVMARTNSVVRAEEIFDLYQQDPRFQARLLHSGLSKTERDRSLRDIEDRTSRVVVCVDMLGEGFDLAALKISAIHDAHQSLGVTLQFVGRFTREADDIGPATAIANVADPKVADALRQLYDQDSDWNSLIQQLADARIEREQERVDFIDGFDSGDETLSLQSIRPKLSMAVYRVPGAVWQPGVAFDRVPESAKFFVAANEEKRTAAIVTRRTERVSWGDTVEVEDVIYDLTLMHLDAEADLLYVHSSDTKRYDSILASAATGVDASRIDGMTVFKVLDGITRLLVANLGLKSAFGRTVAFTMYAGGNVNEGLTSANFRNKLTSNLFGFGFEGGERASVGCSQKGRIWSYRIGSDIADWVSWARSMGAKLLNPNVDPDSFLRTRMSVVSVDSIEPNLLPIAVEWNANVWIRTEDSVQVQFGAAGAIFTLLDVGIDVLSAGARQDLRFKLHTVSDESIYEVDISGDDAVYRLIEGRAVRIRVGRSKWVLIEDWFVEQPPTVFFGNGQQLVGKLLLSEPVGDPGFRYAEVEEWDWSDVDPKQESQKVERRPMSIQYHVIRVLEADESWDVIFDDDDSGEAADVVAISVRDSRMKVALYHCKFAHGAVSASRVDDLYEVCGQAQKSVHWKGDRERLLEHLVKRESARQSKGKGTRFERGSIELLQTLRRQVRDIEAEFEIVIVQPGLSRANISRDQTELLAVTELYLQETFAVKFRVVGGA